MGHRDAVADPDGSQLLTSPEVAEVLSAAVEHAGGRLLGWRLNHVDAQPHHSTTATYTADVAWEFGRRDELLGVSARVGGPVGADERAEIFADGERQLAVWLYPNDPDLPGLSRVAYPERFAAVLNEHRVLPRPVEPDQLRLDMIGYRPRRRAVLRAIVDTASGPRVFYTKVLTASFFDDVLLRHRLLSDAGLPSPRIAAATADGLLVLDELPGRPLAAAIFDPDAPCTAERLIGVLDAMPAQVAGLPRRPPWSDSVAHYAAMVAEAVPQLGARLGRMSDQIHRGLGPLPAGDEPTHGDFHEGQVHVAEGRVCGLLDVDTIGPGRRADDLACLVAHLSTVQRMNAEQAARVRDLLARWVPVFDERVDPSVLRLRAAAVVISLATGPFRSQEPDWQRETVNIVQAAEALVRQVG